MLPAPCASILALLLLSPSALASPSSKRWTAGEAEAALSSTNRVDVAEAGGGLIVVGEGAEQTGGLGLELGQSPGWVGWLSGWGWGEGELTILHPNASSSEVTFPSRAASFTPRLSSPDGDPTDPTTNSSTSSNNPLIGRLLPIQHFSNSTVNGHHTNSSGCPPPRSRSPHFQRGQASELVTFGDLRSGGREGREVRDDLPLVALVVRGDCHFSEKVRWAQALGADAVVVGDQKASADESDAVGRTRTSLITMFSPDDTSDLRIPAVFVSRSAYLSLRDELALSTLPAPGGIEIRLFEDLGWEWPLLDLLLLLLLLPSLLTLATLTLHHFRLAHKRRQDRAPPSVVDALQTRIWTTEGWEKEDDSTDDEGSVTAAGDRDLGNIDARPRPQDEPAVASGSTPRPPPTLPTRSTTPSTDANSISRPPSTSADAVESRSAGKAAAKKKPKQKKVTSRPQQYFAIDECAICLSEFENGETVRILPCGHVFHKDEIDSWLKGWKKLCPTCKADITVPPPHRHPIKPHGHAAAPAPAPTATETTPLLTSTNAAPAALAALDSVDIEAEAGR